LLNRFFFAFVIFSLLILVQNTGWFYSPLLFLLYLAALAIVLLYSFWAGIFFLLAVALLFLSYIDRTTPWYDYVRIAAFFTAIPLSALFSAEFLRLKESEKQILILREQTEKVTNEVERLRQNRLVWNDVLLRQSLATARNFAYYWDANSQGLPPKLQRDLKRMGKKLDEALDDIKKFEKKTVDESYL
jgi:predicted membrane protein